MKNPYAKYLKKRPRSEDQNDAIAAPTSSHELDQSFDDGLDWTEAIKVLDQTSQSYQQKVSQATAVAGNVEVSFLKDNRSEAPRNSHSNDETGKEFSSVVGADRKQPPAASSGAVKPANPYQKSTASRATVICQNDRKQEAASAASVDISNMLQSSDSALRASQSISTASRMVTATGPLSNPLKSSAVLPNEHVPSVSNPPSAPSAHPTRIERPSTWNSSRVTGAYKPSSNTTSNLSMKPTITPGMSILRPSTWDGAKFMPGSNQGHGNRPSSSHGQAPPDNGLPAHLNYAPERVHPVNDEYRQLLVKNAHLSAPLQNGWNLFSHQKKAILRSLLMRRFILALDMGLGKTLIGCMWARAFQQTFEDLKILIVCPVSLKKEWKRTAEEATGLQVDDNADSTSVHIHGWSKVPTEVSSAVSKYVVVFDEAHSMQSMQAARTKSALTLALSPKCVGVLMLSGTPMKNGKPSNLFPLLKAAKHPFGDHQLAYETFFCAGHNKSFRGRVVWDANGSSNLVQLRQHISSHLLHMTKEECLDELPPKTREFRQVPVSSRHQLQHDSALSELAKVYNSSGSLENSGDLVLTAVQRVRQIGSFAKVDATVSLAKHVLQEQPAVVIFTSFVAVAKIVHKQLAEAGWEGELLTGETPAKKRQPMVDNFQAGLSPVFILTYGAGGVGITLTAAHTVILLDRPWTPGEAQQAEDRVRRIGQTKAVTSIWMVAFDLDKQIDGVLEQKQNTCSAVLKDGHDDASASAPKISVFALLKKVLGKSYSSTGPPQISAP